MTASGDAGARRAVASAGSRRGRWHRCSCGRPIPEDVRRCSSRTCLEFAPIWARDTRRRLFVNLEQVKLSVMFSVTAPGADVYPFDPRFCSHPPICKCSGRIGCRVDPVVAQAFNRKAGKWWSQLHRAAKARVQAAAYLGSYFAGGRGRKMAITENVLADDLPRLIVFVNRKLTSRMGCTMRSLRDARRLWASDSLRRHG